jgi:hypothetical protein
VKIWISLLVAPLLALTDQAVSFATVGWACVHQQSFAVHAIHALFLIAAGTSTLPALKSWIRAPDGLGNGDGAGARRPVLAGLGAGVGALSVIVIAAMWMPTWAIDVCSD